MRETEGKGADVILETTGDPDLLNDILMMLRSSGTLVIPAFYEQELNHVMLDRLIVRNCTLVGAAGTPNMGRKILDMLGNGRTSLKPMITDRFPFSQVMQAFEAFDQRNDSRVKVMVEL
jgi:L-iditol 2-dehydrogenase